ncbi:MAG TPA: hypothetical protein VNQ99_05825 [Xanthobacteraceae bacterium]|nr:hypothetical protein [Xanthobacteraceae bacterium]
MSRQWVQEIGFEARPSRRMRRARQPIVFVQFIATVALAISTLVAATAVSMGRARADATMLATSDARWVWIAAGLVLLAATAVHLLMRRRAAR